MNVMIISCFGYYEQRIRFVKDAFESRGYDVEIVFSNFDHINKTKINKGIEGVTYLNARPYYKNLSFARLYSHFKFAKAAYQHVKKQKPDLIYAVIPPNTLGRFLKSYRKKHKITLIYDIYDLWPESFVNKWLERLAQPFFHCWRNMRNRSLYIADYVITECELYQSILKDFLDPEKTKTIYLTKKSDIDEKLAAKTLETIHICYLGSINNIINIEMICRFLVTLQHYCPVVVEVIGRGETKDTFMKSLQDHNITANFHGALYGEDKWEIFRKCHFGINMMINTVQVGLTMKSVDYFEAELPIINNIKGDTWKILQQYNVGYNISDNSIEDIAKQIASLKDKDYEELRKNVKKVFDLKFSEAAFAYAFQPILDKVQLLMHKDILILCNHEIVLFNFKKELVTRLCEEGYNVHISMPFISSLSFFREELHCNCIETKIDRRGINPVIDFQLIKFYHRLIKKIQPDMMFSLTIKPTIYGGLLSRISHINYLTNITGLGSAFQSDNWLRKFVVFMYKAALKNVDNCYFENEDNRNVFLKDKIVSKENSTVVNGAGVNLVEFCYKPLIPKTTLVFAFIGRVMKEKGIDEFLYCVKKLQHESIEFRVYGFCEEEYIDKLESMEKLENFHYYGFCKDIKTIYEDLDVIVLPSYHEGMSNVLLEGAATGRILITTDIFGCKEAVRDNESGFLAKKADSESLLSACRKAIALSFEERVKYGINARNLMLEQFDRNRINNEYMQEFNRILKGVL